MKGLRRYVVAAALAALCQGGLAGPKAAHEQLVTLPVMPRVQSFVPDAKPGDRQLRNTADFGKSLDQRVADRRDPDRFSWGIIGFGVGFNKRF